MNPMLLASSVMTLHNGVPCQTASWSSRITSQIEITTSSFISKSKKTRLLAPQMQKSGSAGSQRAFTSMSLLPQLRLHKYIPEYKTLKIEPFYTAFDWQGHYNPNYSQAHSRQTECLAEMCVWCQCAVHKPNFWSQLSRTCKSWPWKPSGKEQKCHYLQL